MRDVSSPTLIYYRTRSSPEMRSPFLGQWTFREQFTLSLLRTI
jgi:hypothetical protein